MKKPIFFTIILIAAGMFFVYAIGRGFYPAALVGIRPVWSFDFEENVRAAKQFYQTRGVSDPALKIDWDSQDGQKVLAEMRKKVLSSMIEEKIVLAALDADSEKKALQKAEESIGGQEKSEDFAAGLKLLYGWDFKTAKKRLFLPQARREVLAEKLKEDNIEYESWISEQKKKKMIAVFFVGKWNKEKGAVE